MKGRKPKPTALKILQGNPGKRSLKPDAMHLEASPPASGFREPPPHLVGRAREFWFSHAPELVKARLLTDIDWHPFANLCLAHEEVISLTQRINRYRLKRRLTPADDNALMTLEGRRRKAMDTFEKSAHKFGMSPGARASVKIPSGQQELPLGHDPDRDAAAAHASTGAW